ncbi:hypothetical protein FQA39_LY16504 [Lamprigera yunnana]|nr:hypothetical protein FQA39_LY16504 [Lamprigera yunnana]
MKKRAKDTLAKPVQIYAESVLALDNSTRSVMPSEESAKRTLRNHKAKNLPGSTNSLEELSIEVDTWDEARRKLKIAEEKSDVNTTDVENKSSKKIRKRYSRPSSYSNKVSQKYRKVAKKISKSTNAPSVNENNSAIHRTHVDEILTSVSDQQNTYNVLNSANWRMKLDRDLTGIKMQLRQILLYLNNNERNSFNNLPEVQSTIKESEI